MKVGELCAGYGGISMGLRLAGEDVDLRWLAEFDPALDPLHPAGVPNLGDITKIDWSTVEPVDLITAGFPCQPFSAAGSQLAEADPRYLWPAVRDAIAALLPPRVLLENVRNLVSMRKGEIWARILDDLTQLGYDVQWLTLGACRVGAAHHRHRVFALAQAGHVGHDSQVTRLDVQECGAPRGSIMVPTTTMIDHKDSRNETSGRQPGSRHHGGTTLGDFAVIVGGALLPSPSASSYGSNQGGAAGRVGPSSPGCAAPARLDLLPSPQSRDGQGRGTPNADTAAERWASGRRNLDDGLALLPTPAARDGRKGGGKATAIQQAGQRGSSGDLALPSATQPINFDRFQGAVDRHAAILGPPPAPTEPNRNGAPRLAPAFAEWLMCIPAGHVTEALPRATALKAIGNGVCPPQLAAAWRLLTGVDKPNDTSIGFGAMTTSTSADVKEIQDRNAAARGRVIAAGYNGHGGEDVGEQDAARIIEAAMMELAAVWREEAAHVTAAKRKGHVSIAKEYTQAAARLAGFAIGLTSRPVTPIDTSEPVASGLGGPWKTLDGTEYPTEEARDDVSHAAYPFLGCERHEQCRALEPPTFMTVGEAEDYRDPVGLRLTDEVLAALPKDDPVAAVFTSPTWPDPLPPLVPSDDDLARLAASLQPPSPSTRADLITSDQSEEQNLRDIIGPLGASSVTATIDHPFTNPGVPWLNKVRAVEVIPYAQLPTIAAALPPREFVSHSFVETYESCGVKTLLGRASRHGLIGAQRPMWGILGGKAFHSAVEMIERMALSGIVATSTLDDIEALWLQHFEAQVKEQMDALVGTPYADSSTWYISNRGKEGFDWWRVEGAKMLGLYVKHHTAEWRAANQTFLLQDKTPVIELPYTMSIRSLDGERGLTAQGFVDRATLDISSYSLTVLDYKTGARDPESTFQLGEYGHALLMAMGIPDEPPNRPILGRYWLARKGIYTDAVPVVTRHPLVELQYRYDAADRGQRQRIFSPHVTNLCRSCSVTDYCPTQAGRS